MHVETRKAANCPNIRVGRGTHKIDSIRNRDGDKPCNGVVKRS
jgi:hypothetical protein